MTWKSHYEEENNVYYTKATGAKGLKTYYYCNRSGYFSTKGKGVRTIKSQGTNKLDTYCTASIITNKCKTTGILAVYICHTHYGHPLSIGHIPIQKDTRLAIASKLVSGVSGENIINNIRESIGSEIKRIYLLNRKDINNIKQAFKIDNAQKDNDDATSVAAWVEEMKNDQSNPVILYKPQGERQPAHCDNLSDDDFLIALQTPLQQQMLQTFSQDQTVCIDSTYGVTGYEFILTTILVIDEFGEGFPVSWCLSNREDQLLYENFFRAIRDKCGIITSSFSMTDDAEQFYNAWVSVFGKGKMQKLLCSWHVDRAWKAALNKIQDKDMQKTLYHNIRLLMDETSVEKF
jgi:hypothetical protein